MSDKTLDVLQILKEEFEDSFVPTTADRLTSGFNKGIGYAYFVVSDMISQLEAGEEVSIQRPFEINKDNISNQDEN